eukprot:Skav213081  [mRNA]  locus=scaffold3042:220616:224821:- [translate_table: standard]
MAWLPSLVKATAAPSSSPGAWRMELEMVQVSVSIGGDPWHYGPLLLDSTGIKGSFLDGQGKLQQALTLKLLGVAAGARCEAAGELDMMVGWEGSAGAGDDHCPHRSRAALRELSGCAAVDFECPELEMKLSDVEVTLDGTWKSWGWRRLKGG